MALAVTCTVRSDDVVPPVCCRTQPPETLWTVRVWGLLGTGLWVCVSSVGGCEHSGTRTQLSTAGRGVSHPAVLLRALSVRLSLSGQPGYVSLANSFFSRVLSIAVLLFCCIFALCISALLASPSAVVFTAFSGICCPFCLSFSLSLSSFVPGSFCLGCVPLSLPVCACACGRLAVPAPAGRALRPADRPLGSSSRQHGPAN